MNDNVVDLSCTECGSNRMRFPIADEEPLICEDCGAEGQSLHAVKMLMTNGASEKGVATERRSERRERHTSEVEASQAELRSSVAETDRLVVASDKMLRRHRKECDEEEA